MRAALENRRIPALAVSPVIAGAALKGPTVKIMGELGLDASVQGIAKYYGPLIDGLVIDHEDREVSFLQQKLVTNIRMNTTVDRARLAREVLAWVGSFITT